MRDGIYKVYIQGGGTRGFMIGTLAGGKLTGCDQTHHVTGDVREDGSRIRGTLAMRRHSKPEGFAEIAGMDDFDVSFWGFGGIAAGEFDARIEGRSDLPVKASFQWLCGL